MVEWLLNMNFDKTLQKAVHECQELISYFTTWD